MIYRNEYAKVISFPLGGIASGSIGICGDGRLRYRELLTDLYNCSIVC